MHQEFVNHLGGVFALSSPCAQWIRGLLAKYALVGHCLEIVWVPVHDVDSTVLKNKCRMKKCSCTFPVPHNGVNFTFVHVLECAEPRAYG